MGRTSRTFARPFADYQYIKRRGPASIYTDVPGVRLPAGWERVNYEFIRANQRTIAAG